MNSPEQYPVCAFEKPRRIDFKNASAKKEQTLLAAAMYELEIPEEQRDIIACILGTYFDELKVFRGYIDYQIVRKNSKVVSFNVWAERSKAKGIIAAIEHCNPMLQKGGVNEILKLFSDSFKSADHPYHTLPIANILRKTLNPIEVVHEEDGERVKFIHHLDINN